jgi:hypothetical protein
MTFGIIVFGGMLVCLAIAYAASCMFGKEER